MIQRRDRTLEETRSCDHLGGCNDLRSAVAVFGPGIHTEGKDHRLIRLFPGAAFSDIALVRQDGYNFLRHWKRYEVVWELDKTDLIVVVIVQPTTTSLGFWRSLALGMALGAQQMGIHSTTVRTAPARRLSKETTPRI